MNSSLSVGYCPGMQALIQSRPESTDPNLHGPGLDPICAASVLDLHVFEPLRALLDPATLSELYAGLLKQTRLRLSAAEQAGEPDDVRATAHAIRGSAGMLGAAALAGLAAALEAHPVPADGLHQALKTMREGCAALEAALRERQVDL